MASEMAMKPNIEVQVGVFQATSRYLDKEGEIPTKSEAKEAGADIPDPVDRDSSTLVLEGALEGLVVDLRSKNEL